MESTITHILGTVIATRELDFNDDGLKKKVSIQMGEPCKNNQTGRDYYCPFIITGVGKESVQVAYGVDGIQAIELGLKMIGALIHYYQRLYPDKITWNDTPWLGFSAPDDTLKKQAD